MNVFEARPLAPAPQLPSAVGMYREEAESALEKQIEAGLEENPSLAEGRPLTLFLSGTRHPDFSRQMLEIHQQLSRVHRDYVTQMAKGFQTYLHAMAFGEMTVMTADSLWQKEENPRKAALAGAVFHAAQPVLWNPATAAVKANFSVDPPKIRCPYDRFDQQQMLAFFAGRLADCFGDEFAYGDTHVRTPVIERGAAISLQQVTSFRPQGGPWRRGYLCAEMSLPKERLVAKGSAIADTWMLEGCLQAMSFYMTALGYTLDHDGWRFEFIGEAAGQKRLALPGPLPLKRLQYEVFVEEVPSDPRPTLYAAVLVSAEGLQLFHCRRLGIRLVPDWPLETKIPRLKERYPDERGFVLNGFTFNYASLLAGAWGRPSAAFGERYASFDGARRLMRLPAPPYHFMSRITHIEGDLSKKTGVVIEGEYDVPQQEWYFSEKGTPVMPFCVLLEAALQPCGWMTALVGIPLECQEDLYFRNLEGKGTLFGKIVPGSGPLRTIVKLLSVSRTGNTFIEAFAVECRQKEALIYRMETRFGHFPEADLQKQVGLPMAKEEKQQLQDSNLALNLLEKPAAYFNDRLSLPHPPLLMIGKIAGYWPKGGKYQSGCVLAEREIQGKDWYFKAHFFQDPVQPGSLGIEAMLQTLRWYMLHEGLDQGMKQPVFQPLAMDQELEWKYRGQVLPKNKKVQILLHVQETKKDKNGVYAVGEASLWVDGLKIYEVRHLTAALVEGEAAETAGSDAGEGESIVIDPKAEQWLGDHCPTYTRPAYPFMFMLDQIVLQVQKRYPDQVIARVEDVQVHRWLVCDRQQRLKTAIELRAGDRLKATLLCWREASSTSLSRFEPLMTAELTIRNRYSPPPPLIIPALKEPRPIADPYGEELFFHGPRMQVVKQLFYGTNGSRGKISASHPQVPGGILNPLLLDGLMHTIPYDELSLWAGPSLEARLAYPYRISFVEFYAPMPHEGDVHCEVRFAGFHEENPRFPQFDVYLSQAERSLLSMKLVGISFPKGVYGALTRKERKQFFLKEAYFEKAILSERRPEGFFLTLAELKRQNWFPGTLEQVYGLPQNQPEQEKIKWIAIKEFVALELKRHPAQILLEDEGEQAYHPEFPLRRYHFHIWEKEDGVLVKGCLKEMDIAGVNRYWEERLQLKEWITGDIMTGLMQQFVRDYHVEDPAAFSGLVGRGRPVLYFANHQTAVETLLFIYLTSALTNQPLTVIGKKEHEKSTWIGKLISKSGEYPGIRNYLDIFYFDRQDQFSMLPLMKKLKQKILEEKVSLLVHLEGTRSLQCGRPVQKLSSVFADLAVELKLPIVPVRFAGGLPVEPLAQRSEFPYQYGTQSIHLGKPVLPEELLSLPYGERNQKILAAVNAVGMPFASEVPYPGNAAFKEKVETMGREAALDEPRAVILQVLRTLNSPSPETLQIIRPGERQGSYEKGPEKAIWLKRFSNWLLKNEG